MFCVFFFKQKTAYETRISDWSSDVCSSDLDACGCGGRWRSWPCGVHLVLDGGPACANARGPAPGFSRSIVEVGLALHDRGELLGERVVARGEALDLGGEAVVGPHGRDRREQAHRGRDQRLGDAEIGRANV